MIFDNSAFSNIYGHNRGYAGSHIVGFMQLASKWACLNIAAAAGASYTECCDFPAMRGLAK